MQDPEESVSDKKFIETNNLFQNLPNKIFSIENIYLVNYIQFVKP